jgi:hypothetical protein
LPHLNPRFWLGLAKVGSSVGAGVGAYFGAVKLGLPVDFNDVVKLTCKLIDRLFSK